MGCSHGIADSQRESTDKAIKTPSQRKRKGLKDGSSTTSILDSSKRFDEDITKRKEQKNGRQRTTVTLEEPDQKWGGIEQNTEQESLSEESDVEESSRVEEHDQEDKILSGEFRWMSSSCTSASAVEPCSATDSSVDNTSRK